MALTKYLRILLGIEQESSLRASLIKGSGATFILMIVSSSSSFLTALLLARMLGPSSYGMVIYATTIIGFMLIPTVMGMDRLIVRNIASYQSQGQWGLMNGLMRYAHRLASYNAVILITSALFISFLAFSDSTDGTFIQTFWFSLILLPLTALKILRQSVMRGLRRVIYAQIPEIATNPIYITLILVTYWLFKLEITPQKAICLNVLSTVITLGYGTYFMLKFIPNEVKTSTSQYNKKQWLKSGLPLFIIAGIQVINNQTDILMLGVFQSKETIGIYSVAKRGAMLIILILHSANTVLAPFIARIYVRGDLKYLQEIISKGYFIVTILSLPIAICMIFFGNFYLNLFGSEFLNGKTSLIILSLGQISVLLMGSSGMILIMTGHEREAVYGIGAGAIVNVVMNAFLIPHWGITGAAIADALSNFIWSSILSWLALLKLGVLVFPFSFNNTK